MHEGEDVAGLAASASTAANADHGRLE